MFFGILTVWEGPLVLSVTSPRNPEFHVDGAAGFYGLRIYSPEHQKTEWRGDNVSLLARAEISPRGTAIRIRSIAHRLFAMSATAWYLPTGARPGGALHPRRPTGCGHA